MLTFIGAAIIVVPLLLLLVAVGFAVREGHRANGTFGIGGVLTDIGSVFVRAPHLFGISLLIVGLPHLMLFEWAFFAIPPDDWLTATLLLPPVVAFTTGLVMALAATGVALNILDGDAPGLSRALVRSARLWPVALLLAIGFAVIVGLGLVLLVVPGVLLATLLALWVPVLMRGDGNWTSAFGRSMALTEGGRWRLLLLVMITYIVVAIPGAVIDLWVPGATTPMARLSQAAAAAFVAPITPVLFASAYHRLRQDKEGLASDRVEAVFA